MDRNPYEPPRSDVTPPISASGEMVYAGFWIRVLASLIDTILMLFITVPVLLWIYGTDYFLSENLVQGAWDILVSYILPAIAVIAFWVYRAATPGKMAVKIRIVDAKTGGRPSAGQFVGRYFGYFVSMLPLLLGIIWVAFDARKQGWHDKLAGTLVVRETRR